MTLTQFHGYQDSVRWRMTALGIEIDGSGIERTKGAPITATRVWDAYAESINAMARAYRLPAALLVATICTESSGDPDAVRVEPGYASDDATPVKVSVGLMQTLVATARAVMRMRVDRTWLRTPSNSIEAGTRYIFQEARQTH